MDPIPELLLRLATALLLGTALALSSAHRRRANRAGGALRPGGARLLLAVRVTGLLFVLPLLAWIVAPDSVRWAQWPLTAGPRYVGIALQLLALPALIWVLRALGDNISPTQATRRDHRLVTHGPYRLVRHPLYTFGTLFWAGMSLSSALWWLALGLVPLWAMLLWRTPREEANLVAEFGDAYEAYQRRTGRFLPRLQPSDR